MEKLTPEDLYSLEEYARIRPEFRAHVIAHKKTRKLPLGPHLTLHFEDRLTIQYQVQEMLRAERLFEPDEIQDELDAYNPLVPEGSNWKATMMIEYEDENERRNGLARLRGIERHTWVRVDGLDPVYAIADEDLDRDNPEKTASVHFLRFELTPAMVQLVKQGTAISVGCDHPGYPYTLSPIPPDVQKSLLADLG
jgi:uncharacterized protein DUF3501